MPASRASAVYSTRRGLLDGDRSGASQVWDRAGPRAGGGAGGALIGVCLAALFGGCVDLEQPGGSRPDAGPGSSPVLADASPSPGDAAVDDPGSGAADGRWADAGAAEGRDGPSRDLASRRRPEPAGGDGGASDAAAASDGADAVGDAGGPPPCAWGGAPGTCLSSSACAAIPDHTAKSADCATGLACCIQTPDVADNPPIPAGYRLMRQAEVTPEMTDWAVMILHDPVTFPMYATTTRTFGTLTVLARVEWHPPDFQNGIVHRGVTLYVPQ